MLIILPLQAGIKVCLHWPSTTSGSTKVPYRDMSSEARDKVRKCSKSQVAIIARLAAAVPNGTPVTDQSIYESGGEAFGAVTSCHQTIQHGDTAPVDIIRLKLHLANGRVLCALATVLSASPSAQQDYNAAPTSTGEQSGFSMLTGLSVDDARAAAAQYLADTSTVDLYVARYANCYRGNTDVNRHAEEFLLEDSALLDKILEFKCSNSAQYHMPSGRGVGIDGVSNEVDGVKSQGGCQGSSVLVQELHKLSAEQRTCAANLSISKNPPVTGLKLVLYMTYQPCHHSGGRVPKDAMGRLSYASMQHPTSCSERLRDFFISTLKPNGVSLELVLADVYKAIWDEVCETLIFA